MASHKSERNDKYQAMRTDLPFPALKAKREWKLKSVNVVFFECKSENLSWKDEHIIPDYNTN